MSEIRKPLLMLLQILLVLLVSNSLFFETIALREIFSVVPYLAQEWGGKKLLIGMFTVLAIFAYGVPALSLIDWSLSPSRLNPFRKALYTVLLLQTFIAVYFFQITVGLYGFRFMLDKLKFCRNCDSTIAGIDFRERYSDARLIERFGEGCPAFKGGQESREPYTRKYFFPKQKLILEFYKGSSFAQNYHCLKIFKSDGVASADVRSCRAKTELNNPSTGKGIMLGNSEAEVAAAYGLPTETDKDPDGTNTLWYQVAIQGDRTGMRSRENGMGFLSRNNLVTAMFVCVDPQETQK